MFPLMDHDLYTAAASALVKMAQEEEESRAWRGVKRGLGTIGTSAVGMGLGAGAGLGLAHIANSMGLKVPKKYVVPAAGIIGMGTAVAQEAMQQRQTEEMKDALKRRNKNS